MGERLQERGQPLCWCRWGSDGAAPVCRLVHGGALGSFRIEDYITTLVQTGMEAGIYVDPFVVPE